MQPSTLMIAIHRFKKNKTKKQSSTSTLVDFPNFINRVCEHESFTRTPGQGARIRPLSPPLPRCRPPLV